jgi:transcriptional antiterminator NusG
MDDDIEKLMNEGKKKEKKVASEKVKKLIEHEEDEIDELETLEKQEGEELKKLESELKEDERILEKDEEEEKKARNVLDEEIEKEDETIEDEEPVPKLKAKQAKAPILKGAKTEEDEAFIESTSSIKVKDVQVEKEEKKMTTKIFALRTTANREDQVMSFISSNVQRKKLLVYSVIRPHGMRGYIFLEAETMGEAEASAFGVPYARGILPKEIEYREIEHMLERVKKEVNIQKNDIAEIISGPFKREKCKITRIDRQKEEVVVELLEAAVPIPITVKMDAVKVIRRDTADEKEDEF